MRTIFIFVKSFCGAFFLILEIYWQILIVIPL